MRLFTRARGIDAGAEKWMRRPWRDPAFDLRKPQAAPFRPSVRIVSAVLPPTRGAPIASVIALGSILDKPGVVAVALEAFGNEPEDISTGILPRFLNGFVARKQLLKLAGFDGNAGHYLRLDDKRALLARGLHRERYPLPRRFEAVNIRALDVGHCLFTLTLAPKPLAEKDFPKSAAADFPIKRAVQGPVAK